MPATVKRVYPPKLAMGYVPTYFDQRSFSLSGLNRGFHLTPRLAKPPKSYYIDKGVTTVNINAGYAAGPGSTPGRYTPVPPQNTSAFSGPEFIQDSGGGVYFVDMNQDQMDAAAAYVYDRTGGYGVLTSGSQEGRYDNDPFATYAGGGGRDAAFKRLAIARGKVMTAHPGFLDFGHYDGILYLDIGDSTANKRAALSSNAAALAYVKAHAYGPNPYFRDDMEIWRYHPPLLNLYFRAFTSLADKYHEVRMAIRLVKMALAAVGASWPVMVFVFEKTEFVSYRGQGYSERYKRTLRDGGSYEESYFPDFAPVFLWQQAFSALAHAEHYYGWQDTLIYGTDPEIVAVDYTRDDGFPMRKRYGGNVNQVVPVGPTPYNPASTYPYPGTPEGHADLAPIAAEMYAYVARFGGQNVQNARHRKPGPANWCSLDYGYLADRHANQEPVVNLSRTGNQGWIEVADYVSPLTGVYDLEVDVGSATVTVPVDPHQINLFTFSL
ncbi:hypothetical protein [Spirosoma luteum]|uniref:hypothetical protein n=1 Tax=Spirosoma luteum TaxID=431553 RepID=UPI0003A72A3B|nr:hypothetical protein [Spirosoma luteum]